MLRLMLDHACPHGKEGYCLECVYNNAGEKCLEKQEGWRWGLAVRDPATGKDMVTHDPA